MKKINKLSFLILIGVIFAENKRLSFEDVQGKSPFKYASLGFIDWLPNENAYLIKSKDQILKVTVPNLDTTVFLAKKDFEIVGKNVLQSKNSDKAAPWVQTVYQNWEELIKSSTFWLSNDGSKILFASEKNKIWRRSFSATYFYMNLKTKEIFPLSNDNSQIRNAKFSPDSKKIAYVRNDNNLYVYDLTKKRERQLTRDGSEVILNGHFGWVYEEEFGSFDGYRWSKDSEKIAFWREDQSNVPTFLLFDELTLYPSVKKIRYPKAGEANPEMSIFVANIKRGKPKKINVGDTDDVYLPWMEWFNSESLVLMKMNRLQNNWTFLKIFPSGKKYSEGISESDPNGWVQLHRNYHFLKNGNLLWMSERDGWHHIYLHTFEGEVLHQVTSGTWEVKKIVGVDEDREKVYFMANKESVFENRLYSVNFDGSNLKLLTTESGTHSVKVFPNFSGFIDSYSNLNTPSRHLLKDINGNLIKTISETDKSQFEEYDWSYPSIIQFPSADKSMVLDGIITFPPNYKKGKRYPIIVHGYGMPGTQIVYNRWGRSWNQFLAHQGYVVFSLDARGMSGRGEDFKNLSYGDMSKYLSLDTAAGVKHLIEIGIADPAKIGAWGWSGGGYFTGLMLTKNADLFDVGVSVAPVMDFRLYDSIYTERSMGLPKDNKAGYDSTSVLSYVDRFNGKLLVIHGTGDDNVHSQNTTWLVEEFVKHDKQIDVFYYPNRPHGMSGGNARKNLYKKMITYFNENLQGKPLVREAN
tara:strand:+ start:368 stop:2617 length:2250 start_codon:yes stop_codon:yes gene_type:complete